MEKKAKEQGLIDAQGKKEITLKTGETIADEAWNEGATSSYLAAVKLDVTENLTRLAADNDLDPVAFNEKAKAYGAGIIENAVPGIKPILQDQMASTILDQKLKIESNLRTEERKQQRIIQNEAIDILRAESMDAIDSLDIVKSTEKQMEYNTALDSLVISKTIDESEAIKLKQELSSDLDKQVVIGEFKKALDSGTDEEYLKNFASKKLEKSFNPVEREKILSELITIRSRRNNITKVKKVSVTKDINLYLKALGSGFMPSKEDTAIIQDKAESAGLTDEFNKSVSDIQEVSYLARVPTSDRREAIKDLGKGGKLEDFNKWEKLKNIDVQIIRAAEKDGMSLATQQGIVKPVLLDFNNPETFKERSDQAKSLSLHYGVEVSPFTSQEMTSLVDGLDNMTPAEQVDLALSINQMDNSKVFEEITKKKKPVFAMAASIGDTDIMNNIFSGQVELDSGNVKAVAREDYILDFDDYTGDVYRGEDKEAIRKAALAYYANVNGNDPYDSSDFEDVLETITGGVVSINGFKIELPRGVTDDDMEDYIDDFTPDAVKAIGGVDNRTNKDAAEMIQDGQWINVGSNQYIIRTPFGDLMQGGRPLIMTYTESLARINRIRR